MNNNKQLDNFSVTIPSEEGKQTVVFNIVGYDRIYLCENLKTGNIYTAITKLLTAMKNRGDAKYSDDLVQDIVQEAWALHIHLKFDYMTYGSFDFTEKE